tara:strand:- start:179 stop:385 length:207 start_codon:yes stop_codon:yes gene_type:complete
MVYNPIFEEEISRDRELSDLKKAIKLRASKEQLGDVCEKFQDFVKNHPIFTSLVLGVFGFSFAKRQRV